MCTVVEVLEATPGSSDDNCRLPRKTSAASMVVLEDR
jgi:hypothetical protein